MPFGLLRGADETVFQGETTSRCEQPFKIEPLRTGFSYRFALSTQFSDSQMIYTETVDRISTVNKIIAHVHAIEP